MVGQREEKRQFVRLRNNTVEVFGRTVPLPRSRLGRVIVGALFILGGIFSFLPVLGEWMLPVGLLILSVDFAIVRKWRRRANVRWGRRKAKAKGADHPISVDLAERQPAIHHSER